MDINKLAQEAKDAIEFSDSPEANNILMELEKFLLAYNIRQTDPSLYKKLLDLAVKLKVVAFPNLPDKDAEDVLRQYFLESFKIDFPIENALTEKLFLVPYGERNELKEKLKQALLQNSQNLGTLKVGQWLQLFDQAYDPKTRNKSAILQFIIANSYARQLNNADREKLKKTLHIYDYLLIYAPLSVESDESLLYGTFARELSEKPKSLTPEKKLENRRVVAKSGQRPNKISEQREIKEALKTHPNLGEQIVTAQLLSLKHFDQPVRPSIRNWLFDYTSHLGQDSHSTMERTDYLFSSENGKKLSSPERNKLAIILKSFDENISLPIDGERQEVVFESFSDQKTGDGERRPPAGIPKSIQSVSFAKTQEYPMENSFVRPYAPISKAAAPTAPLEKTEPPRQAATGNISSKILPQAGRYEAKDPTEMQFFNPYPQPVTHEVGSERTVSSPVAEEKPTFPKAESIPPPQRIEPQGHENTTQSPIRLKGFSEGTSVLRKNPKNIFSEKASRADKSPFSPPRPPLRPRNIIRPQYAFNEENRPEPKLEGNVVDLSGNNDNP